MKLRRDAFNAVADALYIHYASPDPITVDLMRRSLGVGSDSTHHQWLQEWKAALAQGEAGLPAALRQKVDSAVQSIYSSLAKTARHQLNKAEGEWQERERLAKETLQATIHERDVAISDLADTRQSLHTARNRLEDQSQRIDALQRAVEAAGVNQREAANEAARLTAELHTQCTRHEQELARREQEAERTTRALEAHIEAARAETGRLATLLAETRAQADEAARAAEARVDKLEHNYSAAQTRHRVEVQRLEDELSHSEQRARNDIEKSDARLADLAAERDLARRQLERCNDALAVERRQHNAVIAKMADELAALREALQKRERGSRRPSSRAKRSAEKRD